MTKIPTMVRLDPDAVLRCPQCTEAYLHHRAVDIFARSEDAQNGMHVHVEGDDVSLNGDLAGNPSPRRQGLLLRFACELCEAETSLAIVQDKGMTIMLWQT